MKSLKSRPGSPFLRVVVCVADVQLGGFVLEALARAGYTAECCPSLSSVVDRYNTECHSFLVTDSKNTEESVYERLRELRQLRAGLPVILLSAGPCPSLESLHEERSDVVCLQSPFTQGSLEGAIEQVCIGWHSEAPVASGVRDLPGTANHSSRSK